MTSLVTASIVRNSPASLRGKLSPKAVVSDFLETAAVTEKGTEIPAGRYFIDSRVTPGQNYWYCVTAYDDGTQNWEQDGRSLESVRWATWSGYSEVGVTPNAVTSVEQSRASAFALSQNAPNPFNPTTEISYAVDGGHTSLVIYNVAGQAVRTLVDGNVTAGAHTITWDGKDNMGRSVASGVYTYRLVSGDRQLVRRMTLVR